MKPKTKYTMIWTLAFFFVSAALFVGVAVAFDVRHAQWPLRTPALLNTLLPFLPIIMAALGFILSRISLLPGTRTPR